MSKTRPPWFSCIICLSGIKVNWPPKIRTEYCVVIGCNRVLSVAREVKLSYVGYSHIHYRLVSRHLLDTLFLILTPLKSYFYNEMNRKWTLKFWEIKYNWAFVISYFKILARTMISSLCFTTRD